jgi:hypothetical protein
MKPRIFAWLCLTLSLALVCSVLLRRNVREGVIAEAPANRLARGSNEGGPGLRRIGNEANEVSEAICALAHEGQMERAWKGCEILPPALLAKCAPLVASIQAATDPLGAWQKVSLLADEKLRAVCQKAVLRSASDGNLEELAGLAATLSDAGDRETMLCEIVSRWALQDPAALSQWATLKEMPDAVRDAAASRLVHDGDALNRSPEVAGAWAESITDAGSRATAIETAAREWSAKDREAAREFVRRSPRLDPTTRASILTSLTEETQP